VPGEFWALGGSCLAERLSHYVRLSSGEEEVLDRLEEQDRTFRRGSVVISESDSPRELFIVREGWLHSSVVLGNGSRQIMCFHFKGDIIGLPLLAFRDSPETVTAVTDVILCPFGRERLAAVIGEHPRLAALLLTLNVAGRVGLADRLASIGRTSARTRVASLLCEVYRRMRMLGLARDGSIQLPLTQEDIGDATGLTAVHVNRMMRGLAEDGLIERNGSQLRVLDEGGLCVEANYADRYELETSWLPQPR
jgi:CRP/FNR family transcriptional regulator, anaerobic regulatory protein